LLVNLEEAQGFALFLACLTGWERLVVVLVIQGRILLFLAMAFMVPSPTLLLLQTSLTKEEVPILESWKRLSCIRLPPSKELNRLQPPPELIMETPSPFPLLLLLQLQRLQLGHLHWTSSQLGL
jgi:hypothetical protein